MLAGAIAVVLTMFSLRGGATRHTTVVAAMPYWNFQPGTATVLAHRDAVTEVSPWTYAVFFPLMRMLDAAISLYSVPAAWLSASNGRWKSPACHALGSAATAPLPAAGRPASGSYHAGTRNEPGKPAPVAEASHVSG